MIRRKRWKKIFKKHTSMGMGLHLALAMALPARAGAPKGRNPESPADKPTPASFAPPPAPTGKFDFRKLIDVNLHPEIAQVAREAKEVARLADSAVSLVARVARANQAELLPGVEPCDCIAPAPMTSEEIRLWMESYNAGPYALLRYQGNVPYQETKDYFPKIMKYYKMDLRRTPYDPIIVETARKFALDPQLIRAIVKTESDFNNEEVSHAGARGLMQVMPVVWKDITRRYHVDWNYSSEVFTPRRNIEIACAYLAWLRYDFLPRHFAAFDPNPVAPIALVRDRDLGVPPRKGPRITVASASKTKHKPAIALADEAKPDDSKADNPSPHRTIVKHAKSLTIRKSGGKLVVTDDDKAIADSDSPKPASTAKKRIVVHNPEESEKRPSRAVAEDIRNSKDKDRG